MRCTSPGLSYRFPPADVRIWGLLELSAKLGSTFHAAAIAALIAVLVDFYAPSRLLLTVGVRLASEQGVCGPTPVCILFSSRATVVLRSLSASAYAAITELKHLGDDLAPGDPDTYRVTYKGH